jgi:hypothetical protein
MPESLTAGIASRLPSKPVLAEFCLRQGIRKLAFFGSVLRPDFTEESDVDVLVDFEPDRPVGFRIIDMERELSTHFGGRRVQMIGEKWLSPRLRPRILASAQVQFERTG